MNRVAEDRAEFAARLGLLATNGISARRALALIQEAGSGLDALGRVRAEAGNAAWQSLRSDSVRQRVRRALDTLRGSDIQVVCHDDADYPEMLRLRLADEMPPVLFMRGDARLLDLVGAGIVGSRNASVYGMDVARQLAGAVANAGGCVVSGMARGIDAAAHQGALEMDGATVAVLGCGVDVIYPLHHDKLYRHIAATGLLVSEQLPGDSPRQHTFTYRNRIIAALSAAVVVVEAAARSGAIATANHAARLGVQVFGVPNSLYASGVQGVLGLFRDGAAVYTGARDFVESIGLLQLGEGPRHAREFDGEVPESVAARAGSGDGGGTSDAAAAGNAPVVPGADAPLGTRLWAVLQPEPRHVDELAAVTRTSTAAALACLLELELDGRVDQHAGLRFSRAYGLRHPAAVRG